MAELATLARPYAEAVFKLAVEGDKLEHWSDVLSFLGAIVKDPEMAKIITNPLVDRATVTALLLDVCKGQEAVSFDTQEQNLVKLLAENHKVATIPYLTEQFEAHKAEKEGYIKVELISAYEVSDAEKEQLISALAQRFGKKIEVDVSIDADLLSGWLIRAGDQVIDLSVRGRLNALAADLVA